MAAQRQPVRPDVGPRGDRSQRRGDPRLCIGGDVRGHRHYHRAWHGHRGARRDDRQVLLMSTNPNPFGAGDFAGVFGDGSDGAAVFDGSSTVLGLVPVASKYTLTRDIQCTSAPVNGGVTIQPHGFRIFCQGTVTNNGTIRDDGSAAAGATAGGSIGSGSLGNGRAGGNGGTTTGTQGAGTGVGTAGAGGSGASGAGGAG